MPDNNGLDANIAGKIPRNTMYAPTANAADTHHGASINTSLSDGPFLLRPISLPVVVLHVIAAASRHWQIYPI